FAGEHRRGFEVAAGGYDLLQVGQTDKRAACRSLFADRAIEGVDGGRQGGICGDRGEQKPAPYGGAAIVGGSFSHGSWVGMGFSRIHVNRRNVEMVNILYRK